MNYAKNMELYSEEVTEELKNEYFKAAVKKYNPPKDWLVMFLSVKVSEAFQKALTAPEAADSITKDFIRIGETVSNGGAANALTGKTIDNAADLDNFEI